MRASTLARLTLGYLALPQFIFLPFWLRPSIGWGVAVLLAAGLAVAWRVFGRGGSRPEFGDEATFARKTLIAALVVALLMTFVSGACGLLHQTWDWEKHNAVLLDLTHNRWPVVYQFPEGDGYHLLYYLSYYLPAVVVAKVAGAAAGQAALFAWTALGTWLALLWFAHLVGRRPVLVICAFPLLGGLDAIGYLILNGGLPAWHQNMEAWLRGYVNFANLVIHIWAPQHSLGAWLGSAILVYCAREPARLGAAILAWTLVLFWSTLVCVCLLPVLAWTFLRSHPLRDLLRQAKQAATLVPLAAALAVFGVEGLFLTDGISQIPFSWLWQHEALGPFLPKLALFYLVEFGVYFLLLPRRALEPAHRSLLALAVAILLAAPWIHFGLYNDLAARAAHVGQFLFWVPLMAGVVNASGFGFRRVALLVCLAIGALTPLAQLRFIAIVTAQNPHPIRPEIHVPHLQPIATTAQYFGRTDSWKWRLIGREQPAAFAVAPLPGSEPRPFAAPLLLFNFRGQGIERDTTGWWMWNRDVLELAFRVSDPALVRNHARIGIRFECLANERERAINLTITGAAAPGQKSFVARPGAWSVVALEPMPLTSDEPTLLFTLAEPVPGPSDPQRREFAVKNVRFELLPAPFSGGPGGR